MVRLRVPLLVTLGVALVLTACGPPSPSAPTIHFVGNSSCPTAGQSPYDPSPPGTNGDPVGTAMDEMPHTHVAEGTAVTYMHDPPTSGCHYSTAGSSTSLSAPLQPGVYNQEIPDEYWVHNLEHGYIVVLYNCPSNSCPSDFQALLTWQKGLSADTGYAYAKVLVLPWHSMKDKFAVVSWDWYEGMSALDINKVQAFYANHTGHGPENAG